MPERGVLSLAAVIGGSLRRRRCNLGLSQDDIVEFVKEAGIDGWARSTIMSLEVGRRPLDLNELEIVCAALDTSLVEFLDHGGDQWARLGPEGSASLAHMRGAVAGGHVEPLAQVASPTPRGADPEDEAVRRIAHELNVDPLKVRAAAFQMWGRSVPEERDDRVTELAPAVPSARILQAVRGHVTRQLTRELQLVLTTKAARQRSG